MHPQNFLNDQKDSMWPCMVMVLSGCALAICFHDSVVLEKYGAKNFGAVITEELCQGQAIQNLDKHSVTVMSYKK